MIEAMVAARIVASGTGRRDPGDGPAVAGRGDRHARRVDWAARGRAENQDTEGFWLRPHALHDKLSEQRLRPIRAWFAIGVVGFGLTMLGGTGVATAVVRMLTAD